MPCTKILTLSQDAGDVDYPLDIAVYVPAPVDKIFGMMGAYLCKFNADTAAYESGVLVSAPAESPCGLCYHAPTSSLYVSVWNSMADQWFTATRPKRDIFPVNPTTLEIGARLGLDGKLLDFASPYPISGPMFLVSDGATFIYFVWGNFGTSEQRIGRINPANPASYWATGDMDFYDEFTIQQFAIGGGYGYYPWGQYYRAVRWPLATPASWDDCRLAVGDQPTMLTCACDYCTADGYAYHVGGTKYVMRARDYAANAYDIIDISSVADAAPRPIRIRYRSTDGLFYLPSAGTDTVTIMDPATGLVVDTKTGFASPLDVVFTDTRAFAVQLSSTGLKEIT